jgi:hypothetical protein
MRERPVAGETADMMLIVPTYPKLMLVNLMIDVALVLLSKVTIDGRAAIEKSNFGCTMTVTLTEWDNAPAVPVTRTL